MKKAISFLSLILCFTVLNLKGQTLTITSISPSLVCLPSTGNVSLTVSYSFIHTFPANITTTLELQAMPNATVLSTYSINGSTPSPTVTFFSPNVLNTGTLIAVIPSTIAPWVTGIRLVAWYSITGAYSTPNYTLNFVFPSSPTITASPTPTLCASTSVTLSATGADSYTWMPGNVGSNTINVSPSSNTIYTVSSSNSLCPAVISTQTMAVTVYSLPVVAASNTAICSGKSHTIVPSGASTYTYSSGTNLVSPLTQTNYSITGTNAQGCASSNTAVITVSVNPNPTLAVNSGSICSGDMFIMTPVSNAVSYSYSGSGTASVFPISTTNYTVIAYASSGCTAIAVSSVTVHTTPTISVMNGSICAGQNYTLSPMSIGTLTYSFQGGSNTVSPNSTSVYTISGMSAMGCLSNIVSSTISVHPLPTISVSGGSICAGQSFTIVPQGASTYTITGGSTTVNPSFTSSYSVTGTSSMGCISSNTAIAIVSVTPLPTITVNSGTICAGKIFTINPSGALNYTIQGGSNIVSPATNTTYTVIGTNSMGCVSSVFAVSSVTVYDLPDVKISSSRNNDIICIGETVTLTATGAISYEWNTSLGSQIQVAVSPSVATTYTLTGTDSKSCSNTAIFTQSVSECTMIEYIDRNIEIKVYPIPVYNILKIETEAAVVFSVYSIDGKNILLNSGIEITKMPNGFEFNMTSLQAGIYILEIKEGLTSNNNSKRYRLIKN